MIHLENSGNSYLTFLNEISSVQNTFIENKITVSETKKSLELWITKDFDRLIFNSNPDAQNFYNNVYFDLCDFETEHADCLHAFQEYLADANTLFNFVFPNMQEYLDKYFNALSNFGSNANIIGVLPQFPDAKPDFYFGFFDRYKILRKELRDELYYYNLKVAELEKYKTLNHRNILNNSIIQRLLLQNRATLRRIFDNLILQKIF